MRLNTVVRGCHAGGFLLVSVGGGKNDLPSTFAWAADSGGIIDK